METQGRIFVVALVAIDGDRQRITDYCEETEQISGKRKTKWGRADQQRRLEYLRRIFTSTDLREHLCFAYYRNTRHYEAATIQAIVRCVQRVAQPDYRVSIYIDALAKIKRHAYGAQLRQSGVHVKNIQGVTKDENDALVSVADAIAGFVMDALDSKSPEIVTLFQQVVRDGILLEV